MTKPTNGTIRDSEIYRLDEFKRRTGLGDFAFRQARADGLRTVAIGKKIFVRGCDFVEFVNGKASEETNQPTRQDDERSNDQKRSRF